jgi:hypothetical protein
MLRMGDNLQSGLRGSQRIQVECIHLPTPHFAAAAEARHTPSTGIAGNPVGPSEIPFERALDSCARGSALHIEVFPRLPIDIVHGDLLQFRAEIPTQERDDFLLPRLET